MQQMLINYLTWTYTVGVQWWSDQTLGGVSWYRRFSWNPWQVTHPPGEEGVLKTTHCSRGHLCQWIKWQPGPQRLLYITCSITGDPLTANCTLWAPTLCCSLLSTIPLKCEKHRTVSHPGSKLIYNRKIAYYSQNSLHFQQRGTKHLDINIRCYWSYMPRQARVCREEPRDPFIVKSSLLILIFTRRDHHR